MTSLLPSQTGHRVVAFLACVVVPASTALFSPSFGYTMYSGVVRYQITIESTKSGDTAPVDPDALAPLMGGFAPSFLYGADGLRLARSATALRAHLADFGIGACRLSGADSVRVSLHEVPDDGPPRDTSADVTCR